MDYWHFLWGRRSFNFGFRVFRSITCLGSLKTNRGFNLSVINNEISAHTCQKCFPVTSAATTLTLCVMKSQKHHQRRLSPSCHRLLLRTASKHMICTSAFEAKFSAPAKTSCPFHLRSLTTSRSEKNHRRG